MPSKVIKNQQKPKGSASFMDKFKDKHTVVSKQGLLDLLDQKKKSIQVKKHHRPNSFSSEPIATPKTNKLEELRTPVKLSKSLRKSSQNIQKNSQLYELPKKKLPAISTSISQSQNLKKPLADKPIEPKVIRTASLPNNNKVKVLIQPPTASQVHQKKEAQQKKRDIEFQMSQFAIDHLDFLDKFQERLKEKEPATR